MSRNIIAILRGIKPEEVLDIVHVIVDSGITQVEVPLNSPRAFESIELIRDEFKGSIQFGAGTVTDVEQVEILSRIGVDFIVSPNFEYSVVKATKEAGILSYPGVITPTECFSALNSGADGLKFFPASLLGEANLIAIKAVLPSDIPIYMVGGVGPENFSSWFKAGASGFGIGSGIYKAGESASAVAKKAESIILSYDESLL
jgi:2-dehydro-3-deoxyphosphogalactonate aldolase|tara:strand:+ start:599 stop:1204 length:606 start_codon:yes stop_codon:yes gene_type:complete